MEGLELTLHPDISKSQLINIVCCKRLCFYTTNMFPVPAWNYGNRLASARVVVVERVVLVNGRIPTPPETRLHQFTALTPNIHECINKNTNTSTTTNNNNKNHHHHQNTVKCESDAEEMPDNKTQVK